MSSDTHTFQHCTVSREPAAVEAAPENGENSLQTHVPGVSPGSAL